MKDFWDIIGTEAELVLTPCQFCDRQRIVSTKLPQGLKAKTFNCGKCHETFLARPQDYAKWKQIEAEGTKLFA